MPYPRRGLAEAGLLLYHRSSFGSPFSWARSLLTSPSRALGIDFGTHGSEVTLSWKEDDQTYLDRVPFNGVSEDPEAPLPNANSFEFVAYAALENGRVMSGRRALEKDYNFPLKTFFTKTAGISDDAIRDLPWGVALLSACVSGRITAQNMEHALRDHFTLLVRVAIEQAQTAGLDITTVVLTVPNYLYERDDWFGCYRDHLLDLVELAWRTVGGDEAAEQVTFETCSEGQALALYLCESFQDAQHALQRQRIQELLEGFDKEEGVNFFFVDTGGSTTVCPSSGPYDPPHE